MPMNRLFELRGDRPTFRLMVIRGVLRLAMTVPLVALGPRADAGSLPWRHYQAAFDEFLRQGDFLNAAAALESWERAYGSDANTYAAVIDLLVTEAARVRTEQFERVPENLENVAQIQQTSDGGFLVTTVQYNLELVQAALDSALVASNKYPERLDLLAARATLYGLTGSCDLQIQSYERLIELVGSGDQDLAWRDHRAALEDRGGVVKAVLLQAVLEQGQRQNLDCAERLVELCLQEFPGDAVVHNLAGAYYLELGIDLGRAREHFEKAHEQAPDDFQITSNLAQVYEREGQQEKAAALYQEIADRSQEKDLAQDAREHLHRMIGD